MRYIISLVLAVIIEHFFKKKVQKIVYEILPFIMLYLFILGIVRTFC